eukprot:6173230-Pleurochrysis_carterae.AAC.2
MKQERDKERGGQRGKGRIEWKLISEERIRKTAGDSKPPREGEQIENDLNWMGKGVRARD